MSSKPTSLEQALNSTRTRELYDAIRATPGITLGELMIELGIGWGTLYHHMRKLERAGAVTRIAEGRRSRAHPTGQPAHKQLPRLSPAAGQILKAIHEGRGSNIEEISANTGIPARTTYYHVGRLVKAGLVLKSEPGRWYVNLRVAPEAAPDLGRVQTKVPENADDSTAAPGKSGAAKSRNGERRGHRRRGTS